MSYADFQAKTAELLARIRSGDVRQGPISTEPYTFEIAGTLGTIITQTPGSVEPGVISLPFFVPARPGSGAIGDGSLKDVVPFIPAASGTLKEPTTEGLLPGVIAEQPAASGELEFLPGEEGVSLSPLLLLGIAYLLLK